MVTDEIDEFFKKAVVLIAMFSAAIHRRPWIEGMMGVLLTDCFGEDWRFDDSLKKTLGKRARQIHEGLGLLLDAKKRTVRNEEGVHTAARYGESPERAREAFSVWLKSGLLHAAS